jgi:DNA polymerase III subunit beta
VTTMAVDITQEFDEYLASIEETGSTSEPAFTIDKFVLQGLLEKAASVLPTRDVMLVLKNFYVVVTNHRISIAATDLELSILTSSESVFTQRAGTAILPGKKLLEITKAAEEGSLVVDVKDNLATVSVGPTQWHLKLMSGDDYPELPIVDDIDFHVVDKEKFVNAIAKVRYAACLEVTRPNLMLIDIKNNRMRAADNVRFQQVDVDFPLDIQLPILAVPNLVKLLQASDQQKIEVGEDQNFLAFRVNSDVFIANKLNVVFPNVDQILLEPALENDKELKVDRVELQAAVKRVRINADFVTSAVILSLKSGKLTVLARDRNGNDSTQTIEVHWPYASKEVSFNHQHLLQMLDMSDVKTCVFFLGEDTKQRRQPLLMKDDSTGQLGVLGQTRVDFF